ncbi:LysE family translocator [Agrobacterium vitis]|uniref:LysE family translocator n=1 Tax=Agrobacterium vitis TaxID=373 RepID=A0AAE2REG6_AGRVI|nr:LysE family translocator [Agrobacterium vitis]MBF2716918.1 LysE family translocator [Agrobacterium vitis]MCF1467336.1 LysE family translocator [Agrobacterium vitis]MUZ61601.1 LysE family translocator [Agrobacterium vitis]MVA19746.1 LysE family translocator [Agrobacterium vitis]
MEQILLIASITWLAVLSPGADFAMVSRNSFLYGRKSGLAASMGIAIACWFHVIYAMFGIAIIQHIFPNILDIIKFVGAAYLVYAGLATAFSKIRDIEGSLVPSDRSMGREMMTGILTNGLNPKTSIFVISLYTQFIGKDTPLSHQLLWGLFISLSHFLWFASVSTFLSNPAIRTVVLRRQRLFNILIGVVLASLGAILFTAGTLGSGAQ